MLRTNLVPASYVAPFDFERLYGDEKYSLNNMLLGNARFPDLIDRDLIYSVWTDRIAPELWREAIAHCGQSTYSGDAFFAGVSEENLLLFCQTLAKGLGLKWEVTAGRVVRYTDQYLSPCLRIDMTNGGKMKAKKKRGLIRFDDWEC